MLAHSKNCVLVPVALEIAKQCLSPPEVQLKEMDLLISIPNLTIAEAIVLAFFNIILNGPKPQGSLPIKICNAINEIKAKILINCCRPYLMQVNQNKFFVFYTLFKEHQTSFIKDFQVLEQTHYLTLF